MKSARLTKKQLKIYNSVLANFPATSRDTALEIAIQGGVKFDFKNK